MIVTFIEFVMAIHQAVTSSANGIAAPSLRSSSVRLCPTMEVIKVNNDCKVLSLQLPLLYRVPLNSLLALPLALNHHRVKIYLTDTGAVI